MRRKRPQTKGGDWGSLECGEEAVWDLLVRMRQEMEVVSPAVPVFGSPAASVPV